MRNPATCTDGGGDCALCDEMCIESADRHPEWYGRDTGIAGWYICPICLEQNCPGHNIIHSRDEWYYLNPDGSKHVIMRRIK